MHADAAERPRGREHFSPMPPAASAGRASGIDSDAYARWIEKHSLTESDAQYMGERMMLEWHSRPQFHVVVLHQRGEEEALADTLDSLARQLYRHWGLSVISEEDAPDGFGGIPNLEWHTVSGDQIEAANELVRQSPAAWILMLEPGVHLAPEGLFSLGDYAEQFHAWQLIYSDEDRLSSDGRRHDPLFKPDFNLDLLRSTFYLGRSLAIRRTLLLTLGGYRSFGDATTYDLALRALDAVGEAAIGHVPKVLFHYPDRFRRRRDERAAAEQGRQAVMRHLERSGAAATVRHDVLPGTYDVEYEVAWTPRVSVIIPTRDQARLLKACVDSVLELTSYPDFEVLIVDNASAEPDAIEYLDQVSRHDPRVRVLPYARPYSFSAINNFAVGQATGELLLLLNNDTQVLHDDWMTRMVGHALRPEVGAVGARLVFADGTIQHAGVVLGMNTTADHPAVGTPMTEPGYMGRLQVTQNWSAVTAACLMIRKAIYLEVGGLDEDDFNVLFNDVDLCLKVGKAGFKNVWTPHATLVHHASVSLKATASQAAVERARREREALQDKWGPELANDKAFNRNLSLLSVRICLETQVDPSWDPVFRERPRVMAFPLDAQGTGHYRVWGPLAALDAAGLVQHTFLPAHGRAGATARVPALPELARAAPDTLLIQHGHADLFLDWIERYRKQSGTFLVFGQDDNFFQVPDRNALRPFLPHDIERRIAGTLRHCHRLIVTTEPLVDVYGRFADDVRVVRNQLDGKRWTGLTSLRRVGLKPRVGWAGAEQHHGDLEWLEPVVRALADEVEWVFMGMCPDNLRPYVAEFHEPVPFDKYPGKLASLDLDLAIAPLEIHPFNEAKSDLRILEYGALGWPVVATDIYPYQGRPVTCVPNDPKRWREAIRERVHDLDALEVEGDRLRQWVLRHRLLEHHLGEWLGALFSDEVLRGYGVMPGKAA
jgi:GT2 family glycosyltransferase/glycosyltransferase involved in cell wall biosynthesis